ncbi:OmpW family outer membrane protein [Stenotrophomonas sp. SORGH_AS_0321]|uniref:OmpW family outer membrane protein n=1 Tax=Stenotrophomonas sp. SORGH_AS_0321 TaxID=3041787 RepID=UPI0028563F80|nr:OmpW family outer membrane protein [Stenotrophomonas sp. SORGH_AS_0321]MDR6093201.1 outer membrane protein [Stenotrophomonas sp. SORGH_AS_0321]
MRSLLLTTCLLAFASPAAFAADDTDTASKKRIGVTAGFTVGDAGPAPTASISYLFNDHWAAEVWGTADKLQQNMRMKSGPRVGTYAHQPVALSVQYHFGSADAVFRPFIGVGGFTTNRFEATLTPPAVPAVGTFKGKRNSGYIATVGTDMNINETWFARVDARVLYGRDLSLESEGAPAKLIKVSRPIAGFSIGARF